MTDLEIQLMLIEYEKMLEPIPQIYPKYPQAPLHYEGRLLHFPVKKKQDDQEKKLAS